MMATHLEKHEHCMELNQVALFTLQTELTKKTRQHRSVRSTQMLIQLITQAYLQTILYDQQIDGRMNVWRAHWLRISK